MIKRIARWFKQRKITNEKLQFESGYNWAAGKLLKYGEDVLIDLYQERDGTDFAKGVEAAIDDFMKSEHKAVTSDIVWTFIRTRVI